MATIWVVDAYRATTYFVEPSCPYGMLVTDSFPMLRGPEEWQEYAMLLVRAVYYHTGQVIVMMVLPGGSFQRNQWWEVYPFADAFNKPDFMVWLMAGNDIMSMLGNDSSVPSAGTYWLQGQEDFCRSQVTRLLLKFGRVCPQQRLVYAGASRNLGV